jgi:hypothetical protein
VSWLVSPGLGAAVSLLFSILLPAMIIYLAVERTISSAVVPAKLIWLITRIGWPYLLVVFISNVLSTGPIFVLSVIGSEVSAFFLLPMLAASFAYFTVVNFAMLGYVIFENQGELGYVAGDIDDVAVRNSTDNRLKCLLGEVNVLVKESRHADALKRINLAKSEFRDHPMFFERAVLLALSVKDKNLIESLTDGHLKLLVGKDALDQALDCFRRSIVVHKDFRPSEPGIAHALAEHAYGKNLNKEALTLLINLHQRAPHYDRLGDAYRLAATIMRVGFNNEAKALELENFVAAKGYG